MPTREGTLGERAEAKSMVGLFILSALAMGAKPHILGMFVLAVGNYAFLNGRACQAWSPLPEYNRRELRINQEERAWGAVLFQQK